MSLPAGDLWQSYAWQWSRIRPPLRPSREDVEFTRRAIQDWLPTAEGALPALLVLGVTPELCRVAFDAGCRVIAVEKSPDMIAALWRPRRNGSSAAVCGDWRRIPLANSSIDLAVGDGCLSFLSYPAGYRALLADLRRVLRPGGRCIFRCFVQADRREKSASVLGNAERDRDHGFHAFKFRLMMALQAEAEAGVAVQEIWNTLRRARPEWHDLARRCGWPLSEVLTTRSYRAAQDRYTFPTRAQYLNVFAAAGWAVVDVATPSSYGLSERCPTFVLEARPGEAHP